MDATNVRTGYDSAELWCDNDGKRIYGVAYVPGADGPFPLVIFAHELGNTNNSGKKYAERLASEGIAVYAFDFCGGSPDSRSDGKTTEMSVMTEVSDLEAVLETSKTWSFADQARIVLMGGSQGGTVSAITAARHRDEVAGLVLLYPVFAISDEMHALFSSPEDVPEQTNLLGLIMVGRNYMTDFWDYDVYSEIGNFTKPVLILQGDSDHVVSLPYTERAVSVYRDARLFVLPGAGHGFNGDSLDEAMERIFTYLRENGILI
ncbi:MAG: alpha/beta fold hydrolase [Synergistaceae bacterium]|jgi:dienelactone hydrolase|nr:alpha/beta fold hydrolase [Synergistaceae bacterium]